MNNFNVLDWAEMDKLDALVSRIEASRVDITSSYDRWFKAGVALASSLGESGRSYFHRISQFYAGYNAGECDRKYDDCLCDPNPSVNIATLYHYAKEAGVVLHQCGPQRNQRSVSNGESGDSEDLMPQSGSPRPRKSNAKVNKLVAIRNYLCAHYHDGADLRNDLLSRKIQIRKDATWRDLTDKDICTITCAIAEATDTNITTADVHTVLNSDLVTDVHPLRDWLRRLPDYTPVEGQPSPIEALAAQVHVVGDQSLWQCCFKKWFVAMVASWLYDDIVNHQVLVLISEQQGIYKTTWLEHIIPPELRQYLTKLASARELGKDERLRTAEFGLINMDEIDSMSPRELNVLKSVITTADVNERAAYGRTKERRVRCASFCASGNNRKFLSDDTGNRRWLPFEVVSIENPWGRIEPYADIYAEALYLIRGGFEYWFSQEETHSMAAHTDEFRAQSNEEELLPIYFAPATKDSYDAKALTASEMHRELIDRGHILRPMPINKFGALLQKQGFERRSLNGGGKGYYVRMFDADTVRQHQDAEVSAIRQQLATEETTKEAETTISSAFHFGVPDTTCQSCGGESRGTSRPNDCGAVGQCDLVAEDDRQQDSTIPF